MRVRAVIAQRVVRLSGPCKDLLVDASVLGREFGLDALARLGGLPRAELLEVLHEAMTERVVGEVPGSHGRMRFGHALIRDTLYDGLTSARRLELHRRAGESHEAVNKAFGARYAVAVPLAEQPLLGGLGAAEIADLEAATATLLLGPGDVLCREGEAAADIYFVCSGALRAEVASGDGGAPRPLLTMGPGTALGEIALLDGEPRSATVVATEPSEVRGLSFTALAQVGAAHPDLTVTLYRNLGRLLAWRLRRVTEQGRALER